MKISDLLKGQPRTVLRQAITVFISPVIGLYMIAYWLMGKHCTYRSGNFDVTPLEPITENEYLFTRIFPATVILSGIGLVVGVGYLLGIPIK